MPRDPNDNYPAAALRHYHDGQVLQNAGCHENALCHYAFSVECAQKALLYWRTLSGANGTNPALPRMNHEMSIAWTDVREYLMALSSFDGAVAVVMPRGEMPTKLHQDHPNRRYYKAITITQQELDECQKFSAELEKTIISMILDGLILVE